MSERKPEGEYKPTEKKRARRGFSVDDMERNTFAISLAVVVIGLFCLPNVERGGSTWHVLMLVFGINAVLLIWILCRIINRRRQG